MKKVCSQCGKLLSSQTKGDICRVCSERKSKMIREDESRYFEKPCAGCMKPFLEDEESTDFENDDGIVYRCHQKCFLSLLEND